MDDILKYKLYISNILIIHLITLIIIIKSIGKKNKRKLADKFVYLILYLLSNPLLFLFTIILIIKIASIIRGPVFLLLNIKYNNFSSILPYIFILFTTWLPVIISVNLALQIIKVIYLKDWYYLDFKLLISNVVTKRYYFSIFWITRF